MIRTVTIANYVISDNKDDILIAPNLGSSIGIVIYCPYTHSYALGVIPLPDSGIEMNDPTPMSYVNKAIPYLLDKLQTKTGCLRKEAYIDIYGGNVEENSPHGTYDVGRRNLRACLKTLTNLGLSCFNVEVGGNENRTVTVNVGTGKINVTSISNDSHITP